MSKLSQLIVATLLFSACSVKAPAPYGPTPTPQQLEWQKMEMNMFTHFGPNTFTGREWGLGNEPEDVFDPTNLDCRQWAAVAKDAGFKGIIITAKHHDGFCLWPNPASKHTVAQSKWLGGNGDVLRALSAACSEAKLGFGIYISPWDRYDPNYGTPAYNSVFVKTLESAFAYHGDVFEQWFDGANGEGPNGKKQEYDWNLFNATVGRLQPNAVIFSDVGPGCRWVGNERGEAGETSWSRMDIEGFGPGADAPSRKILNEGQEDGACWVPSETDVSIRPGWFWRESENDKVKSAKELLSIYYSSVGRNSLLLLNVPPDTTGQINSADREALRQFKTALDGVFDENCAKGAKAVASVSRGRSFSAKKILDNEYDTYWASADSILTASITFSLKGVKTFNRVLVQEYIPLGQRVTSFSVEALMDGEWKEIATATTIGYKRILLTDVVTTDKVRLKITGSKACPVLNEFGLFFDENI